MKKSFLLIRAILFCFFLIPWTFLLGLLALTGSLFVKDFRFGSFIMSFWSQGVMWFLNIEIKIEGQENIPQTGCIFVFNHTSYFDATLGAIVFHRLKKQARFGAKSELFQIPIFGWCLKIFNLLPIHRGDKERVFGLYQKSIPRIHRGESFILAGEGGRHKRKHPVGEKFKLGPFLFALQAQCPVVPLLILGGQEVHGKKDFWPNIRQNKAVMRCHFLKPLETKGKSLEQGVLLAEQVRTQMSQKAYAILNESSY